MAETKKTTTKTAEVKKTTAAKTTAAKAPAKKTTTAKAPAKKTAPKTENVEVKAEAPVVEVKAEVKAPVKEVKKEISGPKLQIKLVKSKFGRLAAQKKTLEALGLRKINQIVTKPDNAATRGMIYVVKHMVEVTEIK